MFPQNSPFSFSPERQRAALQSRGKYTLQEINSYGRPSMFQVEDKRPYYENQISNALGRLESLEPGTADHDRIAAEIQMMSGNRDAYRNQMAAQRAAGGMVTNPALESLSPGLGSRSLPYSASMSLLPRAMQATAAQSPVRNVAASSFEQMLMKGNDPSMKALGYDSPEKTLNMLNALRRMGGASQLEASQFPSVAASAPSSAASAPSSAAKTPAAGSPKPPAPTDEVFSLTQPSAGAPGAMEATPITSSSGVFDGILRPQPPLMLQPRQPQAQIPSFSPPRYTGMFNDTLNQPPLMTQPQQPQAQIPKFGPGVAEQNANVFDQTSGMIEAGNGDEVIARMIDAGEFPIDPFYDQGFEESEEALGLSLARMDDRSARMVDPDAALKASVNGAVDTTALTAANVPGYMSARAGAQYADDMARLGANVGRLGNTSDYKRALDLAKTGRLFTANPRAIPGVTTLEVPGLLSYPGINLETRPELSEMLDARSAQRARHQAAVMRNGKYSPVAKQFNTGGIAKGAVGLNAAVGAAGQFSDNTDTQEALGRAIADFDRLVLGGIPGDKSTLADVGEAIANVQKASTLLGRDITFGSVNGLTGGFAGVLANMISPEAAQYLGWGGRAADPYPAVSGFIADVGNRMMGYTQAEEDAKKSPFAPSELRRFRQNAYEADLLDAAIAKRAAEEAARQDMNFGMTVSPFGRTNVGQAPINITKYPKNKTKSSR